MQSWWSQGAHWDFEVQKRRRQRWKIHSPGSLPPLRHSDLKSETEQIENKFSRARHGVMYILENKPCETTCQNRFAMAMNFKELSEAF